jgi:hypothetical protein
MAAALARASDDSSTSGANSPIHVHTILDHDKDIAIRKKIHKK